MGVVARRGGRSKKETAEMWGRLEAPRLEISNPSLFVLLSNGMGASNGLLEPGVLHIVYRESSSRVESELLDMILVSGICVVMGF